MPRYKLTVAYDGTDFHGWQKQKRTANFPVAPDQVGKPAGNVANEAALPSPDETEDAPKDESSLRTVQLILERAVRRVVREEVDVVGASRTDSGVHARGQVAVFTTNAHVPVEKLPRAITARLPDDVQVLRAEIVADDFDPIRGAIAKGYSYRIAHSCASVRGRRPLFDRRFITYSAYRLDPARMNEAARLLLGEHDFTSLTRLNHGRESTVRTIYECKVTATSSTRCRIAVAGNGFLYNMVRIIAGTLVEVGRGAIEPEQITQILADRDRSAAGQTMPPHGLCLMWIKYP